MLIINELQTDMRKKTPRYAEENPTKKNSICGRKPHDYDILIFSISAYKKKYLSLRHNSKPKQYGHVQSNTNPQQWKDRSTPQGHGLGFLRIAENARQVRD